MSYFVLYLCSIADNLNSLFLLFGISITIGTILISLLTYADYCNSDNEKTLHISRKTRKYIPLGLICCFLTCIIPSTKECYAIFGVGATIEYVTSNKELKKIPDNAFKAINYYLEDVIKTDSIK